MEYAFSSSSTGRCRPQRGLALLVALIVLVVMSLAGIAMVRSIDTGILVAGNLAFRQGSAHAGQQGIEVAREWLRAHKSELTADNPDLGYYANAQETLDLTGSLTPGAADDVKWEGAPGMSTARCPEGIVGGDTVCYIIHRLCRLSDIGLESPDCTTKAVPRVGSGLGGYLPTAIYGKLPLEVDRVGYYRITVRTRGPRNTISFLQAFVTI